MKFTRRRMQYWFALSTLLLLSPPLVHAIETCESSLVPKLRVAIAQINTTMSDFEYNADHILRFIDRAIEENADLIVFPELVVTSYPPRDLLEREDFFLEQNRAVRSVQKRLAQRHEKLPRIIFGAITENPSPNGRPFHNSAVGLAPDSEFPKAEFVQHKKLLPNYDVFDELRHFESGTTDNFWLTPWGNLGCTICEDIWINQKTTPLNKYLYGAKDPLRKLLRAPGGLALHVNISGSPFARGKFHARMDVLSRFANRAKTPTIYVNRVGAQDQLIFDGRSVVVSKSGAVLVELPAFEEALGIVDLDLTKPNELLSSKVHLWRGLKGWESTSEKKRYDSEIEVIHDAIVLGIRDYFAKTGYARAVLGISGGIDSAVVATLAVEALGKENVIGISMPSRYSSAGSQSDAQKLAQTLGIKLLEIPIQEPMNALSKDLGSGFKSIEESLKIKVSMDDTTEDNIQARMRMIIETAVANKYDAMVLATSNKSELAVGQNTAWGDLAGALAPIGDLFKTRVFEMAHYLNSVVPRIPSAVLTKAPSAELAPNQTDEAKFGPFAVLDQVLTLYIEQQKSDREIANELSEVLENHGLGLSYVAKTTSIVRANEYKRNQAPIILKISNKAFGIGRRIPIAGYFKPVDEVTLVERNPKEPDSIAQRMLERRAQYRLRTPKP